MEQETISPTKFEYPEEFEILWRIFPKREGSNNKKKAYKAYLARIRQNHLYVNIKNGVERYKKFCNATGKTGTEFVMMAATFFGPDEHFYEPYEVPKAKPVQESWQDKANRLGIDARPGESMEQWKHRVMQHRDDQEMLDAKSDLQGQNQQIDHSDQFQGQ